MTAPAIRPMTLADIDPASVALVDSGFGDRRTWFEFAVTHPACRPVVAELGGEIVGTGVGTANGAAGWIATIWVAPAHRGAGLGRALTEVVIGDLGATGCRTFILVATEQGQRLYEHMGFTVHTNYRILEAPNAVMEAPFTPGAPAPPPPGEADPAIRPFADGDLGPILAMDRQATGEDRSHAIRLFASPETTTVLEVAGELRGFVVRASWGGGATIAPDASDALRILAARRRAGSASGRVRVGLLEENRAGIELLVGQGYRHAWAAPRLIRGAALDWRPAWIWGQLNLALG